jgi:HEAT repeats
MALHNDVLAQLASPDFRDRYYAVRELGSVTESVVVDYLLTAVRDPHPAVRELAFLRLIERGRACIAGSLEMLATDWRSHKAAAAHGGKSRIGYGVWGDGVRTALDVAWQALADEGPLAAERCLLGLMSKNRYDERDAAGYLLVKLGCTEGAVTEPLAELIKQNSGGNTTNALLALFYPDEWHLEKIGHFLPERSDFIHRALPGCSSEVRVSIVEALGSRRAHCQLLKYQDGLSEHQPSGGTYCVARAIETLAVYFVDNPELLRNVEEVCSDYEKRNPFRDRAMI